MMKRFLITLSFSLLTLGFAPSLVAQEAPAAQAPISQVQKAQIRWFTNYSQAVQEAQKAHLPLLLFFTGSDWCGWCKKMHQEIFSSPDFAQAVGNMFVFVDVDFPINRQ